MKPIEYCLDELLKQYYENRTKDHEHRLPFDIEARIKEFGLHTHEEYKGLVDILVEDGYVIFLEGRDNLEYYKKRTVITVRGVYFWENGGYQEKGRRNNAENTRLVNLESHQKCHRTAMTWLTVFVALGTLLSAGYYIWEIWRFYHPCG